MTEVQNNNYPTLQFITCPTCSGSGVFNDKTCPECKSDALVAWTGEVMLYWGKKINYLQLSQDQFKKLVKNGITLTLMLFGALGVIMLGWMLMLLVASDWSFYQIHKIRSWQLVIFWLSMGTNCYLFYRMQQEIDQIKFIPKKKYESTQTVLKPTTWVELQALPNNKKIDISNYFTSEADLAVTKAWQMTNRYHDEKTHPIHLFISLLTFQETQVIFSRLGVPFNSLKNRIQNTLADEISSAGQTVVLSRQVKEIIFQSYIIAYQAKQKKVEITELLEALTTQQNNVNELLYDLNVTLDKIKNVIIWLRIRHQLRSNWIKFRARATLKPKNNMNRAMTAIATPVLDAFSQDLTLLAKAGYLLPCIGREKEIANIFQIMQGGTRRSALLIGHSGVGKNTIIEGVAQKMVEEDVPDFLQDKRLVALDIARLVSGVAAAEAQQRLILLINEVRRSGNIILYVDNIHTMIGITAGRSGSIDLADVMAQILSTNSALVIATSTPSEYKKFIEGKSSLDNVLEKINIEEVSGNEAIQILQSKVGSFEYRNHVFFSYDAIEKTVSLSGRYLHDRYLPEKAIEILQEVSTRVAGQKGKESIVTANDVALIISEKTNIPLAEITQEESEKLLNIEERIHERVIDQVEAVEIVASSLRRARAEMRDIKRPIVNLLFLGPTGVGKTELAKTVAEVYFSNEDNMIRLDMSEYQEKSSVNRLIGAPLGYGENSGGFLSDAIRKNPFSLVLLDEIEKAHPDILNIFLQIMDDGRLTDNTGRTIDFTNAIIIATSNAGTKFIQDEVKKGTSIEQIKEMLMDQHLNQYFRPEFLNRFDGIVVFKPLSISDVQEITKLMLNKIKKNLEEKGITLKATNEAVLELAKNGFDPQFGARPLRRVIQQRVQDPLANYLLAKKIGRRDIVTLEKEGKITITKARQI